MAPLSTQEREARLHRALTEGIALYNNDRFFETHEVLEEVWLDEEGEDKDFLQGLIKVAAGFHHFRKGTYKGMRNLLRDGSEMLRPYRPAYRGVELADFLERVGRWIPRAERLLRGEEIDRSETIPRLVYAPPP